MPNIQGNYSLTELATLLNISSAWINKVQSKTGVCLKENTQGKRAEFSSVDTKMLENVKLLRLLDFSLDEIKQIYELEKRINKLCYSGGRREKEFRTVITDQPIDFTPKGDEYDDVVKEEIINNIEDYSEEEYDKDVKKLFVISAEVGRRIRRVAEDLKALLDRIYENADCAEKSNLFQNNT